MTASELDVRSPSPRELSIGDAVVGLARLAELALEHAEMSFMQYRVLQHLEKGRSIQSDLAFQLSVTKQSVTRLVDGLVERGCIERRADEVDRRRVIHTITPDGERALAHADGLIDAYLMAVLQDLPRDADIEAARAGIRLFGRAMVQSYDRVRPDGITPGRKTREAGSRR